MSIYEKIQFIETMGLLFFFWLNVITCLSEIDEEYLEFLVYIGPSLT